MSLPVRPAKPRAASGKPGPASPPAGKPRKGLGDGTKVVLFLGVFYLFVWPAMALFLVSQAALLPCAGSDGGTCGAYLALESAWPHWGARLLNLLVLLAFALSFLLRLRPGSFASWAVWGARCAVLFSPALLRVSDMNVPVPFPVAWLVGWVQPQLLGIALRLLLVSLVLVLLGQACAFLWRRRRA